MTGITGLAHAGLVVADVDESVEFYCGVLGGELLGTSVDTGAAVNNFGDLAGDGDEVAIRIAMVGIAGIEFELLQYLTPPSTPYHGEPWVAGSAHLAFEVDDIDAVYAELTAKGVQFHTGVNDCVRHGVVVWRWVYFRDPDGSCLELVQHVPSAVAGA